MLASLLWFSGLGLLARPSVWRAVETFTGTTMLVLAALLLRG